MKKIFLVSFLLLTPLLLFSWEYLHTIQPEGDMSTLNLVRVYKCKDGSTATCQDLSMDPYKLTCSGRFRTLEGVDIGKLLQGVGCL